MGSMATLSLVEFATLTSARARTRAKALKFVFKAGARSVVKASLVVLEQSVTRTPTAAFACLSSLATPTSFVYLVSLDNFLKTFCT
jgi:hypothetical protein